MKYFMSLMVSMALTTTALATTEDANRMCQERMPKVTNIQEAITEILDRNVKRDLMSIIYLDYAQIGILINKETDIKISYKFSDTNVVITGTVAAGENSIDFKSSGISLHRYSMETEARLHAEHNSIGQIARQTLNCTINLKDSAFPQRGPIRETIRFSNSATGGDLGYLKLVGGLEMSFRIK